MGVDVSSLREGVCRICAVEEGDVLFESLWLTKGVVYNAYLVKTPEGSVLVDTLPEKFSEELLGVLGGHDVRYIIVNHMEPDHSGSLVRVKEAFPRAEIVISAPGKNIFGIEARPVGNGDTLVLGDVTLRFHTVPWVHWPETMFTELLGEKILFTGDLLGSFGVHDAPEGDTYTHDLLKYTATVLMGYKQFLARSLERVRSIAPNVVAPAHGPVLEGDQIARATEKIERALSGGISNAVLLYATMYGKTKALAMNYACNRKIPAVDVVSTPVSEVLERIFESKEIHIFCPTYEADVFPKVKYIIELAVKKHLLEGKRVYAVCTYIWGSASAKLRTLLENSGAETVKIDDVKNTWALR